MAIAIDQANIGTVNHNALGTNATFNTTQTVASGGFIVLCLGWAFDASAASVTVAGGSLSWTTDKQDGGGVPTGGELAIVSAQAPSGLASGTTLTATFTQQVQARIMGGMSFTGVATSSPVDGTPLGPTRSSTTAWSSGSYSIAAGSVIVACCFSDGAITGSTTTAPSVEAFEVVDPGDAYGMVAEYRIEASAGSYAVAGTWNANSTNDNIAVAYLAAADAAISNEAALRTAHTPVTWRT